MFKHRGSLLLLTYLVISFSACSKKPKDPEPDGIDHTDNSPLTANTDQLKTWTAWKSSKNSRFDMVFIGDSYIQANFFAYKVHDALLSGSFADGGPGYCSFARWNADLLNSIDGSIDNDQLTFTYEPAKWTSSTAGAATLGPCGYVTSKAANAPIQVIGKVPLASLTLEYEKHPNAGEFRYRLNGGSWITVDESAATQAVGTLDIDVSGAGSNFTVDIEPLKAGEIFFGVLGRRTGNVLAFHKLGIGGATAGVFAQSTLWSTSTSLMTPKTAILLFGTNEMDGNISPAEMKVTMQNLVDKVRQMNAACDIMIVCPPETKLQKEDPRKYKLGDYANMLYQLALDNQAAYLNLSKVLGPFSQASVDQGLMSDDRLHPGAKGSDKIADAILAILNK
ncbi:SGNH/GDSL hydrolase family protein [Hufsiella ginkgonis]|uniref:SGNH hydrolase-type esterase domain-containing protein n=1 Tax=Hufsiella ginkgonis TaxID=2695274 RepID=A0A7K1XZC7_9SPHI|nr:GDSL-type esterase/lipase family protein [Hufsiella ginkgonis]MXV16089.1 hypothetical protein [Hufsiella ginkgonis]